MEASVCGMQPVRFPLASAEGETILSYAIRVGGHNLHGHPLELLSTLRNGRRIKSIWNLDPEALSRIYRQPVGAIAPLVAIEREDGRVDVGDRAIRPRDLLCSDRRISPAGLRTRGADRSDWAIRALTFCPANWEMLLDTCPNAHCRATLTWWTRSIFHCGVCGYDLRQARTARIKRGDRKNLQILPDLLNKNEHVVDLAKAQLPEELRGLSPQDLIEIVRMVGRGILAASKPGARWANAHYPHVWLAGTTNLKNPQTIRSIMSGKDQASRYRHFVTEVRRWLPRLSLVGAETFREFLDPEYQLAPKRSDRLVTLRKAAAQLRIECSAVRKLIELGHLEVFRAAGPGRERQRDLVTAASLAALPRDRASISSISAAYKIPKDVLLGLVRLGALDVLQHPAFSEIYSEVQLKLHHAHALLDSMVAKIQSRSNDPTACRRVAAKPLLDSLGGGDHLWANLLWNDLNDRLEHGLSTTCSSSLRLDALLLHPADAEAIARGARDLTSGELSQSTAIRLKQAEMRLCMHPCDIQVLIRRGKLTRYATGVSDASVRDAAKRFISTREISRLTRIDVYEIAKAAAARGLTRLWPRVGIWDRAAAMTAFADLLEADDLEHAA